MLKLFDDELKPGESPTGIIHECDFCGRRGRWTDTWSWFGSDNDIDNGVILKCCGCQPEDEKTAAKLLTQKKRRLGRSRS